MHPSALFLAWREKKRWKPTTTLMVIHLCVRVRTPQPYSIRVTKNLSATRSNTAATINTIISFAFFPLARIEYNHLHFSWIYKIIHIVRVEREQVDRQKTKLIDTEKECSRQFPSMTIFYSLNRIFITLQCSPVRQIANCFRHNKKSSEKKSKNCSRKLLCWWLLIFYRDRLMLEHWFDSCLFSLYHFI